MRRHRSRVQRGFVLIAVLWVLVGLGSLGLMLSLAGRDTVTAARNRLSLARAYWLAEGCIQIVRAVVSDALLDGARGDVAWRSLDDLVARSPILSDAGCNLEVRASGATLDVNSVGAEQLRRLLLALHVLPMAADSLVDALLDWRDTDDSPRPLGAEREWYIAQHRLAPRNAPIADVRELARVRGYDVLSGLDSVLGTDSGRVDVGRAPPAVLASLPGFAAETADRIEELRLRGALPSELSSLAGLLSPSARDSLAAHYAEVAPLVTMDPDAWIVRASAHDGDSPAVTTVEVRLVRAGARVGVSRHRSWP